MPFHIQAGPRSEKGLSFRETRASTTPNGRVPAHSVELVLSRSMGSGTCFEVLGGDRTGVTQATFIWSSDIRRRGRI